MSAEGVLGGFLIEGLILKRAKGSGSGCAGSQGSSLLHAKSQAPSQKRAEHEPVL